MSAAGLPLLGHRDLAAPLAWCDGQPVSGAQFLGEALALARRLPAAGSPVNLCQDRYAFALGLAAALVRGQTSLMPPNVLPDTLQQLGAIAQAPYALVDDERIDSAGLPRVVVRRQTGAAPATMVPAVAADLDAVCLLTSGSTGPPQPHVKRWDQLRANIAAEAERLAILIERPSIAGLNVVATVPAQHSYGFESTVLLALLGGAVFDAGRPFYPADIAATLQRLPPPRALVTTPFHLKALLGAGVELPHVELLLSATAPLSPQLAALAEQRCGARLVEIYGCTEAGQVAARRTTAGETWTALAGLRLWREAGQDGERFMVAGGHVLEPTPLADVLELVDAQHFRLLGRANDLIHVAGKRSSLAHLNFHLNRIEGVHDGAFWMPEEAADGVSRPVAFVVAPALSAAQVIQALRERVEPAFVPRRVVHVTELPREATGKLTTQTLRDFARQALGEPQPGEWFVAPDHPAFDGHFPGQPVLPGVLLLTAALRALAAQPDLQRRIGALPTVDQVKFLAPVLPGTRLHVALQGTSADRVGFEVRAGTRIVARGVLAPGQEP